ncbi:hypothetical protein AB2D03_13970, partial [Pseudomonas aeruginosa]
MKGPVATVELWEKGQCVFSHAVTRALLQAAVDEGCHLGSVAKIVKLEHAWRRLDGRNDDGFQV